MKSIHLMSDDELTEATNRVDVKLAENITQIDLRGGKVIEFNAAMLQIHLGVLLRAEAQARMLAHVTLAVSDG